MFNSIYSDVYIFNTLLQKAIAYSSIREIGDSNIKRIVARSYNVIESTNITFNNNVALVSNGLHIDFPNVKEDSYNIITDIVLDKSTDSEGYTAVSNIRFGNNLRSVFVYVNGIKVPDSSIHLYITNSHTNILIPKKYFDKTKTNSILIEEREFLNYSYGGTRVPEFNSNTLSFTASSHRQLVINKNTCMVFINGLYISENSIVSVTTTGNTITIVFKEIMTGDLELFIDSSIGYKKTTNITGGKNVPFCIDDSFVDPLYGPINGDNCSFFVDGRRISNNEIDHIGRLNFLYTTNTPLINSVVTILFSDSGIIDKMSNKIYNDDYYYYNMMGTDDITKSTVNIDISKKYSNEILTKLGNISNINNYLTLVEKTFDVDSVKKYIDEYLKYDKIIDLMKEINNPNIPIDKRITTIIAEYPFLIKDFLEFFAANPKQIEYIWDGITNPIIIGSNNNYPHNARVIRVVTVNGKIAKMRKFTVTSNSIDNKVVLDKKWFKVGLNKIEILENVQTKKYEPYKVVEINRIENSFDDIVYRVECDIFGNIETIHDFVVLAICKREFDPSGIYFSDAKYGFRVIDVPRMVFDGIDSSKIIVDFGSVDPRIDMLIISNIRHHEIYNFDIKEFDDSYESLFHRLYIGMERFYENNEYHDVKVPLIHNGTMIVSSSGTGIRYFNGIDYLYRTPFNTSKLRESGLVLKRTLDSNDDLLIAIVPDFTHSIEFPPMTIEDTGDNKYGLLYLSNLRFPFSHKYIDVYANNKKMFENDIDILSAKLIRLYKEEVSLQNVIVQSNFTVSFTNLKPYIQLYRDSDFEINIRKLFGCYDFFNNDIGNLPKIYSDTLYECFTEGVDSNKKTPNPKRTSDLAVNRYNLYLDAYIRYHISDRCNHLLDPTNNIPDKILDELAIFRDETAGDSWDAFIRPHINEIMNTIPLLSLDYYDGLTYEGTVLNYIESCLDNGVSNLELHKYTNSKYGNRVYVQDLVSIDPTRFLETLTDDICIGGI